jgi:hypothetical protein
MESSDRGVSQAAITEAATEKDQLVATGALTVDELSFKESQKRLSDTTRFSGR